MTFEDPASVALVLGREHVLDGKAVSRRGFVRDLPTHYEDRSTPSGQFLEKSTCAIPATLWEGCHLQRRQSQ
jgi:hypothetical protein